MKLLMIVDNSNARKDYFIIDHYFDEKDGILYWKDGCGFKYRENIDNLELAAVAAYPITNISGITYIKVASQKLQSF